MAETPLSQQPFDPKLPAPSLEDLEATFNSVVDQPRPAPTIRPGRPTQAKPGERFGPGFIELPPAKGKMSLDQAVDITYGNIRRSTESFRSFALDVAVKGTLASQLGRAATTSQFARTNPLLRGLKITRFATANALGDILGEVALQEVEIALGQREELSKLEIAASGGLSFLGSTAFPIMTRFAARIGKQAPRDIKELMFRGLINQFKLIWPKRIADPAVRAGSKFSSELILGKRFMLKSLGILKGPENQAVKNLAGQLGESIGVTPETFGVPSAIRNMNHLHKAAQQGVKVDLRPLLDQGFEIATERITPQAPFKRATSEAITFLAEMEEKYAAQGLLVSPQEFNQIASELEDRALSTILRMKGGGQQLASPLAREAEASRLFFNMHKSAKNIMSDTMDAFTDGAWSINRRITSETLNNAEEVVKRMSNDKMIRFVENAPKNETVMLLVREFDKINGTKFGDEIFELFLSRRLAGGKQAQTEPITGLARTLAPFLVIMTQVARGAAIATRPASALVGPLVSTGFREGKRGIESTRLRLEEARLQRESDESIESLEREFNNQSLRQSAEQ